MEATRWRRVREVFDAALARPVEKRAAAIVELCGDDASLAAQVRTLLDAHEDSADFLERPAWDGEATAPPDRGLEAGDRLGPWRIVEILGEGGMGVVYRASRDDGAFDREVAIKCVRVESAELHARFDAERRILADLDHPGIAQLLDAGTTPDGHPYFVLELVDGVPIDRWCAERAVPLRDRLGIFVEACAAVSFAQQRLVLHRDIKPSNILVTKVGAPKLLDFGIAKLLDPETGGERAMTLTAPGLRAFTAEYASPEQLAGEPLDTSSDVWSLGVVLFRLLTGHAPYGGPTLARITEPHERSNVLPPSASAALGAASSAASSATRIGDDAPTAAAWPIRSHELRGDLDVILGRALEPDRSRRYRTVAELEDDLRRHLDGRPVLARPPSAGYLLLRFARRNRVAVVTAALSAVGLVAAAAVSLRQASVARRQRDHAARRFAVGRELANKFLFDLHDAIGGTAGTTEARDVLARTGIQYLDRLAAEAGDDETLQREIARAYDRWGLLHGAMQASNLGETGAGLESFEKASRLRRRMLERGTEDDDLLREVAQGELGLAQALLTAGHFREAARHSALALKHETRLAADHSNEREAAIDLGHALAIHGYAVAAAGELERALPYLRRAVSVLEPLQDDAEPGDRAVRAYTLAVQRLALQ